MTKHFTEDNPGRLTRVEREGHEVKIVFTAGTDEEAEDLAQFVVMSLRKGGLNFQVIESHQTVM